MNNMKCGLYIYRAPHEKFKNWGIVVYEQFMNQQGRHEWLELAKYFSKFSAGHIAKGRPSYVAVDFQLVGPGSLNWLDSDRAFHVKQDQP